MKNKNFDIFKVNDKYKIDLILNKFN